MRKFVLFLALLPTPAFAYISEIEAGITSSGSTDSFHAFIQALMQQLAAMIS